MRLLVINLTAILIKASGMKPDSANDKRNLDIYYCISITLPGIKDIKSGELKDLRASFSLAGGSSVSSSVNAKVPQCMPKAFQLPGLT